MPQPSDMPLREQAFARALLDRARPAPSGLRARPGIDPAERFGVYRNNVLAGLSAVLQARFPVTERLVGKGFFAFMAQEFVAAHPPVSPVLIEYGATFADHVTSFEPARGLSYLPDIVRLEWALHDATHAADAEPADLLALQSMAPDRIADLRFRLHPSLRLLASAYPIVSIWRTNTFDRAPQPIASDLPGEGALVIRPHLAAEMHALSRGARSLVAALQSGATLAAAAEAGAVDDVNFDPTAALAMLFRSGAVIAYDLAPTHSPGVH